MKIVSLSKLHLKEVMILLTLVLLHFQSAYSQDHSCGFDDSGGQASIASGFQGIKFFDENLGCIPLTLKCNFVIIRRDDGTGNIDPSSPFWGEWEQQMNDLLSNITDDEMCSTGYPLDSKVRVEFEVHTINNTAAWDWYAEANADNFPSTSSPNSRYICPRFDNSWTGLEDAMTTFEQLHFGEINFFFIENGELVSLLEDHIANNTEPSEPYLDRFAAAGKKLASGCSIRPQDYFSQTSENSYVIAHTYSDYMMRNYFHHIWWPEYADLSAATLWSWSYWGKRLLFLHEMGHNVLDMFHDNSCSQLMSSNWPRTHYITKTQLERLHRTLATTDLHNAVDCTKLDDVCPVQVVSNETLDKPMSVFGDLIIKQGVTFTVKSGIYFSEKSRLIVEKNAKLIVDGGLLTSGCGATWTGIKVYGGNADFDVKFTNGATIENTLSAAVSMFAPEPWPQIQQFGNGILLADNTVFNNTRRIVEFMSWSPLPNPSYIKNCVQNGGRWSITNWNCQGIEISGNEFNNISDECIVTDSGSFKILNNEFNSGQSDILFNNVSAGIYTLVESNVFKGANIGYNARGTTFSQNEIKNNSFQTGFVDVMNDGHNQFSLFLNTMTATYGSACFDNGGGVADIFNNDFSGNLAGALSIGRNEDYNFFENCYATTFMDNFINGRVSPLIHSNGSASNNCFTHSGSTISSIQDIGGTPETFIYLEPNDIAVDCRDAVLSHGNVNRVPDGTPSLPDCGSTITIGATTLNYCWPDRSIKNDVFNAYVWLQNKLNEIENNSSLTAQQKAISKQIYLNCFKRVRGYLFEIYIGEEEFQDARDLYSNELHDDSKVYIFSSYIMENDLSEARTYLNSITALNEPMEDFKIIQNINLDRIPYGPYYNASSNQLDSIETIALKSHPYAAYGKALYYVLTGEVISSEIPNIGQGGIQNKNTNSDYEHKEVEVYPNPFTDQLNIQTIGYEDVDIRITDFYGREVYSKTTKISQEIINTNNWINGIYIVTVKNGEEIILLEKVLLIK